MATASLPGSAGEPLAPEMVDLVYTTKYDFLPLGVRKIKQVFDGKLAKENMSAHCDYKRATSSFYVTCAAAESDAVFELFHKIINQFLEEEVGYDDGYGDEIDSRLVARAVFEPDVEEVSDEIQKSTTNPSEVDEAFPFWLEWECPSENLNMDKIIPRAVQVQIEELTGTKLIEDLNLQVIHIGSKSEETGENALHKLYVLRDSFDIAQRPTTHHVFYAEERENFQASIKQLVKIPEKLAQTTLLDPFRNQDSALQYRKVHKLCTIRCCYFDPTRSSYLLKAGMPLFPLVQEEDKGVEFRPWKNYVYPGLGKKRHLTMSTEPAVFIDEEEEIPISPLNPEECKENVERWLADNELPDTMEQINVWEEAEEPKTREEKVMEWLADDTSTNILTRGEQPSSDLRVTGNLSVEYHSRNEWGDQNVAERLLLKRMGKNNRNPSISFGDPSLNHPDTQIKNFEELPESSLSREGSYRTVLDDPDVWHNVHHPHAPSNTTINPPNAMHDSHQTRELMGKASCQENQPQILTDIANVPDVLPGSKATQLANIVENRFQGQISRDGTPIQDRAQIDSEVDSRIYHNTMGQGSPRKEKGKGRAFMGSSNLIPAASTLTSKEGQSVVPEPADPTEEFIQATQEKIKLLLSTMRIWQGELVLEVQFGRIILRGVSKTLAAWGESHLSYPLHQMDWILDKYCKTQDFTGILTQIGADAQWVVDLKNISNERMWKDVPRCSVTYEFECFDEKSSAWFMIVMDARTAKTKVRSLPKEIGTVWVHCTLRSWDYRLAATGSKSLDKEYGHIAAEIAKSIYIRPGLKNLSMLFEIDEKHGITFNFVRVVRTALYPSTGNGSQLKITEVHDLRIGKYWTGNIFCASEAEKLMDAGFPSMWYQISLISPIAERVLEENIHVEFGEQTTWTEDDFDERVHVFDSLCRPACYLVKKMDGMGFYNDNGCVVLPASGPSAPTGASTVISEFTAMDIPPLPPSDPAQW